MEETTWETDLYGKIILKWTLECEGVGSIQLPVTVSNGRILWMQYCICIYIYIYIHQKEKRTEYQALCLWDTMYFVPTWVGVCETL